MRYLITRGPAIITQAATLAEADAARKAAGSGAKILNLPATLELLERLGDGRTWHRVTRGRCSDERMTQARLIQHEARKVFHD